MGSCKACLHELHFVDNQSVARRRSQCCVCIFAMSLPRNEVLPRNSSSQSEQWNCVAVQQEKPPQHYRRGLLRQRFTNTAGSTPLWGAGSIPNLWADVCGFLKPSGSDRYWKVRKDGAFSIPREALSLRPSDQRCHHETWIHLDFVDWDWSQPRYEASDQRILHLKERPTPYHYGHHIMSDNSLSS